MSRQNYKNHRRFVPMFHYFLALLIIATFIGSIVNLVESVEKSAGVYSASLIVAVSVALIFTFYYLRIFALRAQDRAIRAEENLRYFTKNGKLLDPRLTIRQIVGLRFASDGEFEALCERAISEGLSEDDIKKAISNWRADNDRV